MEFIGKLLLILIDFLSKKERKGMVEDRIKRFEELEILLNSDKDIEFRKKWGENYFVMYDED